jgi:hypothetical protein
MAADESQTTGYENLHAGSFGHLMLLSVGTER